MSASITRRLVVMLAIPLGVMVLLGALGDYYINVAEQLRHSQQRLSQALDAVAARVQARPGEVSFAAPDSLQLIGVSYVVRDERQQLIAGDKQLLAITPDKQSDRIQALTINEVALYVLSRELTTVAGKAVIIVAEPIEGIWSLTRFGILYKLLWDFILLDLVLIVAWVGVKVGLRPLRALRDEVAGRSPQDLRPIVERGVPREIAPLVITLNRLFALLNHSSEAQQRLVANTAHQLRTPITGINAQLNLLSVDPAAAAIKERVASLQESVRQLARHTNQLLTLARADSAANLLVHNQPIELQAFTRELVNRFVDQAVAADIDLGVEAQPLWVHADLSLFDDLLGNLLDNALKYTPRHGTVTVSAGLHEGQPFLRVEDTGSGIPENETQRVRQRYYRIAGSTVQGSGLGLAIVDEITRLYRGTLSITPGSSGRGSCIRVQFPPSLLIKSPKT